MPWFRNTIQTNGNFRPGVLNGDAAVAAAKYHNIDLAKRTVKLISHQQTSSDDADARLSPPVSSSRRSPSPDQDGDNDVEVVTCKGDSGDGDSLGPIRCRTPKQVDVWRPY